MYNKRRDWENRYRLRIRGNEPDGNGYTTGQVVRQLKFGTPDNKYARLEDQRVQTFSLGGEHHFNKLTMNWKGNYSKASEERPNERYMAYRVRNLTSQFDFSDPQKPKATNFSKDINDFGNFNLNELTEAYQYTKDKDLSGKIDFLLPFNTSGAWKNSLGFGAAFKSKSKSNNEDYYEYEPTDEDAFDALVAGNLKDQTRDNFLAGDYKLGMFPDKKVFGDMAFEGNSAFTGEKDLETDIADFDAKEDIFATYLRYDQRLNDQIDLILGVRMELTKSNYNGNKWNSDTETIERINGKSDSYTNFLPGVIAKWDVSNDFKVKAAWTNTLARPKYIDLAPIQNLNYGDDEISLGNPDLVPAKSMNFDLMAEYYINGGLFSAGIFYKDIKDFIVEERLTNQTVNGTTWAKYSRPINAGNADLLGFEVSVQQNLNFFPGFLRYFNVYLNYTYNHSNVKNFNYEGRENDKLSLPGTPENTFNAALGYDSRRFSARLSYNFASDFIDELGEEAFYDRYYDKVNYLDFNANVKVGKYVNIFANVNNILNQPLRYYQGSKEYTMQVEYYNFRFDAGVKLVF